jgi:tetratricopeptide (TPR) repeat protein
VYYSNRSAALLASQRHRDALTDGRKCVELRPGWAKGFARVGAALFALERYTEVLLPGCWQKTSGAIVAMQVAMTDRDIKATVGPHSQLSNRGKATDSSNLYASLHVQAKEVYRKALDLEPDDGQLQARTRLYATTYDAHCRVSSIHVRVSFHRA